MPTMLGHPTDLDSPSPDAIARIERLVLDLRAATAEAHAQHAAAMAALIEAVTGKPYYLLPQAKGDKA
jgi:hypothetical protein